MRTIFLRLLCCLACLSVLVVASCAGKSKVAEEEGGTDNAEYLLYLANVQGNPLCVFVSIQKVLTSPWIGSPKRRWRVKSWLAVPGVSRELFYEKGKDKDAPSAPLSWTKKTLLFATDSDQFVFYEPVDKGKLLLLTDPIFLDRVRKSGDEDIRYGLIPSALYWNNLKISGRIFCEKQNLTGSEGASSFLPLTRSGAGGRAYAFWEPDGVFLHVEEQGANEGASPVFAAVMQDRRGRWQETFDVKVSDPQQAVLDGGGEAQADASLRMEFPFWKTKGEFEVIQEVIGGVETPEEGAGKGKTGEERNLWATLEKTSLEKREGPIGFRLFRGILSINDETKSVYGVEIREK